MNLKYIFFGFFLIMTSIALVLSLGQEEDNSIVKLNISSPQQDGIQILEQNYFSEFIEWNFTKVNDTEWRADYLINQTLISDIQTCLSLPPIQKIICLQDLYIEYFSDFNLTNFLVDINNLNNYPLINLTDGITISKPS